MSNPDADFVLQQFQDSIALKERLVADTAMLRLVGRLGEVLVERYRCGNKLLIAGNGGSAADAQHIVAEFVNRFNFERPGLPAQALTTDSSILTGIGNDYGFEYLFSRQLEANGSEGDVFIGISTSGNSANIVRALTTARQKGMTTIGLSGQSGGAMRSLCDYCLCVPSEDTPRIQEVHILIGHTLCAIVERALFQVL